MEQELFSTAQIAAELEHKSKNPRRDVLNIAKRLGFSPVATRPREGKNHGGKPEMLWSREQHDAILDYNRKRYNDGNIQDARADVTDTEGTAATVTPGTAQANDDEIIATPNEQTITATNAPKSETVSEFAPPLLPATVIESCDAETACTEALEGKTLDDLAAEANLYTARGDKCLGESLTFYFAAGRRLNEAKKRVGHGNWQNWLADNFSSSADTAENYMKIARRFGNQNPNQFRNLGLTSMIRLAALPKGTEQEFIDAQAAAGKPIETQSARDVQKNVKAFKDAHATPKENAEEPTPDLSNCGEKFSVFGRETDEVNDDDRPVVSEPITQDSAKQDETAADDFEPQNFAELIIDEEFSSILPPLKEYEFNLLEENLLRDGILDPLKVWNGILLDGHARYEIAKRHNLPFKIVEVKSVTDRDDAIIWIIKNQLARRSLNQYERAQIVLKLQNEPQKK